MTIVPSTAVVQEGEASFVYVVTPDHVAHRRPLVAGIVADGEVEVRSGVDANESVIVAGQNALPDGAAVTPTEQGTSSGAMPTPATEPESGTPPR